MAWSLTNCTSKSKPVVIQAVREIAVVYKIRNNNMYIA